MSTTDAPVLHRDDTDRAPLAGNTKVTREDWLNMARDALVRDGVEQVKILPLSARMGVSRSSFYWYFRNREGILGALLDEWEIRNTTRLRDRCALPATTIAEAVCHFFGCFLEPAGFDPGLDFAVREWSRRDEGVRARVDAADAARLAAITEMFSRHGHAPADADARARILYFMQLGYHALDVRESLETRMSRIEPYLHGFTGSAPEEETIRRFLSRVRAWHTA